MKNKKTYPEKKKKVGRPRKIKTEVEVEVVKRKRGRPRKIVETLSEFDRAEIEMKKAIKEKKKELAGKKLSEKNMVKAEKIRENDFSKMGKPRSVGSIEEMQEKVDQFFEEHTHDENGILLPVEEWKPLTITGLALHLGFTTRNSLLDYESYDDNDYLCIVKKAKTRIEQYAEMMMYKGKAAGPIFALKNIGGWRDERANVITGKDGGPVQTETKYEINKKDLDEAILKLKDKL